MKLETYLYTDGWDVTPNENLDSADTLVLVFFDSDIEKIDKPLSELISKYPNSVIFGASTSGEIFQNELYEDSLSVAIMKFENTKLKHFICQEVSSETSYDVGLSISNALKDDDLKGIFILSEGLNINGSKLTQAISSVISPDIAVTGGLAGDKADFNKTWIISKGIVHTNCICAVGFYGEHINFKYASKGGWDSIGLKRVITKSKDNVVYEFDHKPALEIYKRYLGDKASQLPASGLLFPLEIKQSNDSQESKIRTILAINEDENSITFAADLAEGSIVTFMKANVNRLIHGANEAAEELDLESYNGQDILCIAISCVGRRLVLKSNTEEELDTVLDTLPEKTKQIGFYSYGEISPLKSGKCDLHNQTMTLTLIWEDDA